MSLIPMHHVIDLCQQKSCMLQLAGPAISASGKRTWPGTATPVPGLTVCGDSCMPGIGVPAAAASGMMAANSLAPVWDHLKVLEELSL
jgi:hypothetical protein